MRNDVIMTKIRLYVKKVLHYCDGLSYEEFEANSMVIDACVFNLSQIGELAHKVDDEYKQAHPEVPFAKLYGLRNKIVHDYDGVRMTVIWDIVQWNLPDLLTTLDLLLN